MSDSVDALIDTMREAAHGAAEVIRRNAVLVDAIAKNYERLSSGSAGAGQEQQ